MKKLFFKILLSGFILLFLPLLPINGDISLPSLVSDGMVLQRDTEINIWGWGSPGEKVRVKFDRKTFSTLTDHTGKWMIKIPPMKAGGPHSMEIRGRNTIIIKDILAGDVWFCSGQSNMVLNMERVKERYPSDIAAADYPQIRNFFIPTVSDATREHDEVPPGKWIAASPTNVLGFGALTYFFARDLYDEYKVPIGIINSSVGGTPIEAWISKEGFSEFPLLSKRSANLRDTAWLNPVMKTAAKALEMMQKPPENYPPADRGISGPIPWFDNSYVPEGWKKFWLPGYWEDQGIKDLDGIVWFRKEVIVPESMAGKPAKLFMGRIVDADNVWVNGTEAGGITYQYPPRRYELKEEILRPGRNIIVVKVTNNSGKGGFVPDKPYFLVIGKDSIDLRGEWLYKVGQAFRTASPVPGSGVQRISMQDEPAGLYNTMVAPLVNYRIKGFLWYQGETNTSRPNEYSGLLRTLITDWRNKWNQGPLPFLYVQLANFMEVRYLPAESQWAALRNSQLKALSVPNAAMAVTIDAGEWNDIHPLEKKVVGERLALAAKRLAYKNDAIVYSGPIIKSVTGEGDKLILEFEHTGSGLAVKGGGDLNCFELAGSDRKFVWAEASVENNKVVVRSKEITQPVYVRYAWADNPESANLYNAEGLPASPFEAEKAK